MRAVADVEGREGMLALDGEDRDDGLPRVGRPPRVQLTEILDAAIAIGLDGVTLRAVAEHLEIGVATLYRHVRNRDEMVRLAAFRLALTRRLPLAECDAAGQHWSEVVTAYAQSLFDAFAGEPQLLVELMHGRLGPDIEVDFLEPFLAALARAGFSVEEGIRLHHAVAMTAIGAAVGATAVRATATTSADSLAVAMRRAIDRRPPGSVPHVEAGMDFYLSLRPEHWEQALHHLLAGVAQARGESLPDARPQVRMQPTDSQGDMS